MIDRGVTLNNLRYTARLAPASCRRQEYIRPNNFLSIIGCL